MKPDRERKISIFEQMLLMRRFEEMVIRLSTEGHVLGHFHVYTGQEATGAAILDLLQDDDLILSTHRNHGHIIGRGADPGRALAEIMGRVDGFNGGRGGTLHLCARSAGFLSTSAVVGGSIGLAIGAAYALKESRGDAISVAFFGDGALEEGIAFESLNIAALYDLPVLFVCENNSGGAAGAAAGEYPSSEMHAKQLIDIPGSLGIRSEIIDGADVSAIQQTVSGALAGIRARSGPVFLETRTERWPGSRPLWPENLTGFTDLSMAWDKSKISGEYADWIKNDDPVLLLAQELVETENVSQATILEIDQRVVEQMSSAREFALDSPLPEAATALSGVFAGKDHSGTPSRSSH